MPFQGNPNAGAADPALLSLLFQQRANREKQAFEQQKYEMEFQRQAALDKAEEDRKNELHRLTRLEKHAALQDKVRAFGASIDSARRNAEENATKFSLEDLYGPGGGEDFASIVKQIDPSAGPTDPTSLQNSDFAQANFASTLRQGSELLGEVDPTADPIQALLGGGQAVETQRAREAGLVESVKEEDAARAETAAIAASRRSLNNSLAVSKAEYRQSLNRQSDSFLETNAKIRKLIERSDALVEKDPVKAASLREDARGLAAMRDFDLTRGQPEGAIANAKEVVDLQQRLDLGVNLVENLNEIKEVSSGGATADVERFLSNAVGLANDLGTLFTVPGGSFEQVQNRKDVPEELKEMLTTVLVRGMDPERQRQLSTSELTMARLKWYLIVEGSRGRVSLQEMKEVGKITDVNTFTTSQLRAKGRLDSALQEVARGNDSIRRSVKLLSPEVQFDSKGRISVGDLPSFPGSQTIAPGQTDTQVEIQPPVSPVQALRDKNATLPEAIRAAKAAAMQRVGVKP